MTQGSNPYLALRGAALAEAQAGFPELAVDGGDIATGWALVNRVPGTVLPRVRRRAEIRVSDLPEGVLVEVIVERQSRRTARNLLYVGWGGFHVWRDRTRDMEREAELLAAVRKRVAPPPEDSAVTDD